MILLDAWTFNEGDGSSDRAGVFAMNRRGLSVNSPKFVHQGQRNNFRYATLVGFLLGIGALVACQMQQQVIIQHEENLAAAGFTMRPPNTPELQTMLNQLPAHHVVQRIRADKIRYVYADPDVCDCLYVGSQQAYDLYKQID
jgi:hypothetical protein